MSKPEFPPENGWDRHSIYAEILRQGMTIKELAEQAEMSRRAFSHVWTRTVRAAETVISEFLETPAKELWPDRYPVRTSHRVSTKQMTRRASQKSLVAPDRKAA